MIDAAKKKRWTEAAVISLAFALAFNYWWTKKLNDENISGGLPSIENEDIASFAGTLTSGGVGSHISYPNFPYYKYHAGASNWVAGGRSVVTNSTGTWAA